MTDDVVVVGGGVIGASVAYHLADAGAQVRLLERGELGGEASGAAAGMLLPLDEADGKDALVAWGLRSLAAYPELVDDLLELSGVDPEYEPSGALHVASTEQGERRLRDKAESLVAYGATWLPAGVVRERAPQLAPGLRGALWCPREGHVRSSLLVRAFARAAVRRGARVETGREVQSLLRVGSRVTGVVADGTTLAAGHVVLCTGAWAARIADRPDLRAVLPIEPVRGQIVALDAPDPALREVVMGEGAYLVPRRDGSLWVGATEERTGFDDRVTAEGVSQLLASALALSPALEGCAFRRAWSGLRPGTPDGLPAIGPVRGASGLVLAVGHYRNGVLLAPVTGQLVAAQVKTGRLPDDAAAFDPARFAAGG